MRVHHWAGRACCCVHTSDSSLQLGGGWAAPTLELLHTALLKMLSCLLEHINIQSHWLGTKEWPELWHLYSSVLVLNIKRSSVFKLLPTHTR